MPGKKKKSKMPLYTKILTAFPSSHSKLSSDVLIQVSGAQAQGHSDTRDPSSSVPTMM